MDTRHFQDHFDSDGLPNPLENLINDFQAGYGVQITLIHSGADTKCPRTNRFIKWKMPSCCGSQKKRRRDSPWKVHLKLVRPHQNDSVTSWVYFENRDEFVDVPLQSEPRSQTLDMSLVEEHLTIVLQGILDSPCTDEPVKLFLCFQQQSEIASYDVCLFQIKELQVEVQVNEDEYSDDGSIGIREKKQMVTGPHKGRCQRLEKKELKFLLRMNTKLQDVILQGYVKRRNDEAMAGKERAVTGEIEVPLSSLSNNTPDTNGLPGVVNYSYSITADLDPEQFYVDYPGKELYTSDKTTPENNIFIFGIRVCIGLQSHTKEVYQFKTKSKEYSTNKHQYISAMELEAARAHIRDLKIQKLTTARGDIAYSWQLLNAENEGRFEEGDVVGIFPSKVELNEHTYLDLLTPRNYKDAILAGVITRSYYIAANSQQDEASKPSEKICMLGKIPIKIYGSVKHGDFIFASNKLPGVGVTEEQLIADKGNWREKRLLGYSLEASHKRDIKLVSCVVSILLSINNDQVERLLGKLENTLSESVGRRIDEFRDDVDIKMDGMNQIVNTTRDYMVTKRKESYRRMCRVCSAILLVFIIGILSCYFFLSPTSPYIKWKCRRGSLPGRVSFKIENKDDEELIRMEGILFDVARLRDKIDVNFGLKENFTGSYYFNLRKCKRDNLRKVLGWFSSPPVYCRAQVFAVSCDCKEIFHYHQYHSWVQYDPVFYLHCRGEKISPCSHVTPTR